VNLLRERLVAWKHICGHLEDWIIVVSKDQTSQAKEQEKILKTLNNPIKEPHHFDTALGGITGLLENIRANTLAQSNMHTETSITLTSQVLPVLELLHAGIKSKDKELTGGAAKGSKNIDASWSATQKHIELLRHNIAIVDSIVGTVGGRVDAKNDPYVLQRGVYYRLNRQLLEENSNRQELLDAQSQFQQFEAHIMDTIQSAMNSFHQIMGGQAERQKAIYADIASASQNIPVDHEWNGFVQRNRKVLIDPNAPPRSMDNISFPNQGHRTTKPLIEGTLERKSRGVSALKGYSSGYYVVTRAGFLHKYKDNDNYRKDPIPEVSLYLPDSTAGALDGTKFTIKGKDLSGSRVGQKLAISSEFNFRALTTADAQKWHSIIVSQAGASSSSVPVSPVTPVDSRNVTPIRTNTDSGEQHGIVAAPQTATSISTKSSPTGVGSHFRKKGAEDVAV
jgi:hypothetical protein